MSCESKKRYDRVGDAFRAMVRTPGSAYLNLYYCADHRALHVGHQRLFRSYDSWPAALAGARDISANKPGRRLRVFRNHGAWSVTWAART